MKMGKVFMVACLLAYICNVGAEEPVTSAQADTAVDYRQFAEMPPGALVLMRQDMLDHLVVLTQVLGLLAENKLNEAADVAESRLGRSSMGKHRMSKTPPGRFMPNEMRQLGWGMHDAASEFADEARQGDTGKALLALQKVTSSCMACHMSYRTR